MNRFQNKAVYVTQVDDQSIPLENQVNPKHKG